MHMDDKYIFTRQFKAFYMQYAEELIFFARKFVDEHTAKDIVHDVFLKIWDKKSTIITEKEMKSYLFQMVQNACYDYIKHKTVEDSFVSKAVKQLKLDELDYYSTKEDLWMIKKDDILAYIEQLPLKCRIVFKKAYFEEQKYADIALEMNLSIRTVETHIYNALKFLRDKLIMLGMILLFAI